MGTQREIQPWWAACWGIGALLLGLSLAAEPVGRQDVQMAKPVSAEAAYRAVGEAFGVEVEVEEGLGDARLRVDLESVTRAEAFDLLSRAVGHFWWEDEEGTVRVARDTPNRRQEVGRTVSQSFSLERARSGEAATALRSFGFGRVDVDEGAVGVEMAEGEERRAELVIQALEGKPGNATVHWLATFRGMPVEAPDPDLGSEAARRLWIPAGERWETLQEAVEETFGVDLVLDPSILHPGGGRLLLEEASLFEALEALTAPVGRFWTPLGGRRILIAENTPQKRATWEPKGLAVFPLERAEPRVVRETLRELGVRRTAVGTDPPVVLALDTPAGLALARTVVGAAEAAGSEDAGSTTLWLGTGSRPRLAEAQLLLHPGTEEARRLSLERRGPPELRPHASPAAETPAGAGSSARGGSDGEASPEGSIPLLRALRGDLGLHVDVACCHWPVPIGDLKAPRPGAGAERHPFLDALAREHSLLWTALGPDTVHLAPDEPYPRTVAGHRGLAAIPLDGADEDALRDHAAELGIDTVAVLHEPRPVLFALGEWGALQALVAASDPETATGNSGDQSVAGSPRPGSSRSR